MHSKKYFLRPDDLETKMSALIKVYNLVFPHAENAEEGTYDAITFQLLINPDNSGIVLIRSSIGDVFVGFSELSNQTLEEESIILPPEVSSLLYFVQDIIPEDTKSEFILWRTEDDTVWNHDRNGKEENFIRLTDGLLMSSEKLHDTLFDQFLYDSPELVPDDFTLERIKSITA